MHSDPSHRLHVPVQTDHFPAPFPGKHPRHAHLTDLAGLPEYSKQVHTALHGLGFYSQQSPYRPPTVVPPWLSGERGQKTEDGRLNVGEKIEIVINSGLSFGTGNHFTTRFCLEQLDRFVPQSGAKTMLDVGTGSGVLAIAAVKLGAEQAMGVDFDLICVECSQENAEANGVAYKTAFCQHDITHGWPPARPVFRAEGEPCSSDSRNRESMASSLVDAHKYDIVCANIYSTLLIDNASTLLRLVGKYLLLTGIREMELDGVADTFVQLGGKEIVRDSDNEWGGLVFSITD